MTVLARLIVALLVLAALVVVACGEGDEDKIRSVAELVPEDDPAICGSLTKKFLKRSFGGGVKECRREMREDYDWVEVETVKINGERATVTADSSDSAIRLYFIKHAGEWKINRFALAEPTMEDRDADGPSRPGGKGGGAESHDGPRDR